MSSREKKYLEREVKCSVFMSAMPTCNNASMFVWCMAVVLNGISFNIARSYFCHFLLNKPAYNSVVFEPPCNRFCPAYFASYFTLKNDGGLTNVAGTRWRRWLQPSAANRKLAGSISNSIIRILYGHNPPAALWSWNRLSL
jgi:hypothetical protein